MNVISNPVELAQKIKERQGRILIDPIISDTIVKIKGVENVKCVDFKETVPSLGVCHGAIDVSSMWSILSSVDATTLEAILREIIKGAAAGFGGYMIKMGMDSIRAEIENRNMRTAIREKYDVEVVLDKGRIIQCEMSLKTVEKLGNFFNYK